VQIVQLVSKISNLIHQRHRPTDRRTTCNLNTAPMHYSASRGKNCRRSFVSGLELCCQSNKDWHYSSSR